MLLVQFLFNSHIYNPIPTGGNKPSIVSQLRSPSRRTGTVKGAIIILRDESESLCERSLQLFFLEHGACAGDRSEDFVGDQLSGLAQSGGGGDVRIDPVPSIYSSARPELDWSRHASADRRPRSVYRHHTYMISSFVLALISAFKARRELVPADE